MEWRAEFRRVIMTELRQALDDISAIEPRLARGTQFRGYGPLSVASSRSSRFSSPAAESALDGPVELRLEVIFERLDSNSRRVGVPVGAETIFRARRVHSGLAMEMIQCGRAVSSTVSSWNFG